MVLNLDIPFTNNSNKETYNNKEDLFDILENSQEINDLANSFIESNGSNYNNIKENRDNYKDKIEDIIIINDSNIINIEENGSTLSQNNYIKEKKFDTYDSLFNNPIPNSNNFRYQFEEYDQNSQYPLDEYLHSNKKEKINSRLSIENNNQKINDFELNDDNNNKINNNNNILNINENEVNKKKNTIDILTKEYMMKKMVSKNLKKNENKFFNLKKAMNTQQKNNY